MEDHKKTSDQSYLELFQKIYGQSFVKESNGEWRFQTCSRAWRPNIEPSLQNHDTSDKPHQ